MKLTKEKMRQMLRTENDLIFVDLFYSLRNLQNKT